jgi:Tol biopolymer transport system component
MASALQSNLWIVPAAGGEETQVTFGSGENGNPAWSPTGA